MTSPQNKAVTNYRQRQKKMGFVRVELNVPETDRDLIKKAAANLRAGGDLAEKTRMALLSVINPFEGMGLKELLEAAPLEELDLERSRETWRDIDF
jgi:hypothetical protein